MTPKIRITLFASPAAKELRNICVYCIPFRYYDQPNGSLFSIRWRHKYFPSRAIGYSLRQATCTTFTSASISIFVALHTLLESSVTITGTIYDQYSHCGIYARYHPPSLGCYGIYYLLASRCLFLRFPELY